MADGLVPAPPRQMARHLYPADARYHRKAGSATYMGWLALLFQVQDWLEEHHAADCRRVVTGGTCSCGVAALVEEIEDAVHPEVYGAEHL